MTHPRDRAAADDLLRLWQDTALPAPDPEQLARRVARLTLTRFDRVIIRRNVREYAGFVILVLGNAFIWWVGGDRVFVAASSVAGLVVVFHLWWQHRRLAPIDPAADARAYQAQLVARIDHQLRLLRSMRYWYLLPLYLPMLWVVVMAARQSLVVALVGWAVMTAVFVVIGWGNERVAVPHLEQTRARVARLYEGQDS